MLEQFPHVKVGDHLTAEHVERINEVCRRLVKMNPGAFSMGRDGQKAGFPAFEQRQAIIVSEGYPTGMALGVDGLYEFRFRYHAVDDPDEGDPLFEEDDDESSASSASSFSSNLFYHDDAPPWATDGDGDPQILDAREGGQAFDVDDKVVVFCDAQRGMWIPVVSSYSPKLIMGTVVGSYPPQMTGAPAVFNFGVAGSYVTIQPWGSLASPAAIGLGNPSSVGNWSVVNAANFSSALFTNVISNANDINYVHNSTANDVIYCPLGNMPSIFQEATGCAANVRWMWDSTPASVSQNDIRRPILQVVAANLTTPLTQAVELPPTNPEGVPILQRSDLPIIGPTDLATWNGALLKIDTGPRSHGRIVLYSALLQVSYTHQDITPTSDNLTPLGVPHIPAYLRMGGVRMNAWVYAYKFPWGYEIIQAECR